MTHPMLEKVARAMYENHPVSRPLDGGQWAWDWLVDAKWAIVDSYRELARAAVQALLEPDEGMKQAGAEELFASVEEDWGEDARRIYRAMLAPLLEGE